MGEAFLALVLHHRAPHSSVIQKTLLYLPGQGVFRCARHKDDQQCASTADGRTQKRERRVKLTHPDVCSGAEKIFWPWRKLRGQEALSELFSRPW